ncbi:aspartate kinase [Echinicola marina]|uniref:aspartate kinase n=1 Tax=Echinicola marina TaxID=2859768 RepID=UPI001CF6AACE|nr:aspartate kinase [Echinicola marina]UCS95174.1 aspartate kinase [Echinicola marina]
MTKAIVYKFGGASVKDASAIKNLHTVLLNRLQNKMVIVVSAMGKTTNSLEEILKCKFSGNDYYSNCAILRKNHLAVCSALFEEQNPVFSIVENLFLQLERDLEHPLNRENYDQYYDRIVSYGEILSSKIIHAYLCTMGLYCVWQDAKEIIATDESFRSAKIDWSLTAKQCAKQLGEKLKKFPVITQGFLGASPAGKWTTLGREGSDFSAAIIAHSIQAKSVTIWKDVPGVLNADPKRFADTVKFDRIDYKEAAEMTYYGASVIHPKTIKPLANLKIPLNVRSFLDPEGNGTIIGDFPEERHTIPTIVVKDRQVLVTFEVTDYTFINESHIHHVYAELERLRLGVNMLQTSAISISICVNEELFKVEQLLEEMGDSFKIRYNEGLQLLTVKNYDEASKEQFLGREGILVEQTTRSTIQLVCKPDV